MIRNPGAERTIAEPSSASGDLTGEGPRAYWLSPAGLAMLAVTGLALAVRVYLLSRPGYLTGVTEYDDGVYLGGAVSLLSGVLPYHGFAFVQPPGILLLMAAAALLAKASAATTAMAAARLLTVVASCAGVTLVGALVRHRGTVVTLVACGTLAVYPDDIMSAHTLLLEPWMNLFVLAGACLAFRGGRLASPRHLLWAGVLFGFAGAVKYWAAIPAFVLLALCLAARRGDAAGAGRAARFAGGLLAGFTVPVLPFAAPWPGLFIRSTLLDQAARSGSAVPVSLRLAHLTGLADLLSDAGRLTASGNEGTLFARFDVTAAATWADGWLPAALAAALAGVLALGFAVGRRRAGAGAGAGPLEWYALVTLGGTLAAVLGYSAFFYHYPDFAAPWLAIAAGYAASALWPRPAQRGLTIAAAAFVLAAGFQAWEVSGSRAPGVQADAAMIPPGACVVTDEISLAIAANRFTVGVGGCPDVLDSLAITLVAGNGVSVEAGAQALPRVVAGWQRIFSHAQYVWLSGSSDRRIPWSPELKSWFAGNFHPVHPPAGQLSEGLVYARKAAYPPSGDKSGGRATP